MEQSTQTNNIIEKPKKKKGIPKGTATYTEEEAKERARQRARLNYSLNFEKEDTVIIGENCKHCKSPYIYIYLYT